MLKGVSRHGIENVEESLVGETRNLVHCGLKLLLDKVAGGQGERRHLGSRRAVYPRCQKVTVQSANKKEEERNKVIG